MLTGFAFPSLSRRSPSNSNDLLRATPHGADEERAILTEGADETVEEVHEPRDQRTVGVGSRRPVAGRDGRAEDRIERGLEPSIIYDALQLPHVWDPPVIVPRIACSAFRING